MAGLDQLETDIINYSFVVILLLICIAIGMYHGFRGKDHHTPEEYLVGNRNMSLVPVAMSIFVTFYSSISLMGIPAEMYLYGTMHMYMAVGITLSLVVACFTLVPLLHPLRITSAYEYLELRFHSRSVRMLGVLISMLQTTIYMGITLYAPALALQTVAGIPLWLSIIIAGGVGIIYTSIGGIKSVVWTDVFQCFIIFGGTIAILIKEILEISNSDEDFGKIINDGNRLIFDDFSPDPRVRHSVWSLSVGGFFVWLSSWCSQSSIQRISSLKAKTSAGCAFIITIPFSIVYGALMGTLGLVLYAYYNHKKCGPLEAGYVKNANQLMPYFVFDVMRDYPGLPGIYISALFSGSLSTVSSGINSLAANTVEDLLKHKLANLSKFQVTLVAKFTVVVFGGIAIGIAYIAQTVPGPVTQISLATFGACGGPLTGLFFLGALFPFANWIGAFVGAFLAFAVNMWLSIGGTLYGQKAPKLEPNPISGCSVNNSTLNSTDFTYVSTTITTLSATLPTSTLSSTSNSVDSSHFPLYDLSYMWYGLTGFLLTIFFGVIISCATGGDKAHKTEAKYLFTFCRRFAKDQEDEIKYLANEKPQRELATFDNVLSGYKEPRLPEERQNRQNHVLEKF